MRTQKRLNLTRLSSKFEIVKVEDLSTFKGGGDSDDWQGSPGSPDDPKELDPVVVTPDDPDDGGGIPDPEPDDDDYDDDDNDDEDNDPTDDEGWDNDHGEDPVEEEPECTCEIGKEAVNNDVNKGDVKDPNNLLVNLKNTLSANAAVYKGILDNPNYNYQGTMTLDSVTKAYNNVTAAQAMIKSIEDSDRGFRIEAGGVNGETSKDTTTGEYVLRIGQSNNGYSNDALLLHEIVHASQVLNGQIGFDAAGHPTMVGMEDEIAAFQAQVTLEYGAQIAPTVDTAFINSHFPGMYNNLPVSGGKCPVHG